MNSVQNYFRIRHTSCSPYRTASWVPMVSTIERFHCIPHCRKIGVSMQPFICVFLVTSILIMPASSSGSHYMLHRETCMDDSLPFSLPFFHYVIHKRGAMRHIHPRLSKALVALGVRSKTSKFEDLGMFGFINRSSQTFTFPIH